MNCEQFRDVLQDLARYDGLDSRTLREALEHADSCVACDRLLDEAEALSVELRSLAAFDGSRQAPQRLEESVMAAFARRRSVARRAVHLRIGVAASLIGAAALAFFGLILLRHTRAGGPQAPPSFASPAHSNGSGAQSAAVESDPSADALADFEAPDSSGGSFVPLTQSFDPSTLDSAAVLRVALSRSDLAGLGISAGGSGSRPVLADMIVASDGTPQAIRLVAGR